MQRVSDSASAKSPFLDSTDHFQYRNVTTKVIPVNPRTQAHHPVLVLTGAQLAAAPGANLTDR